MREVFEFSSYKDYLRFLLKSESRGLLSRLAEAAECQRPYLSKVLQRDSEVQLTPDHMFGICNYLSLSENEVQYLNLLLEKERAASLKYREHLAERIKELRNEHLNLKRQIGKEELDQADTSTSNLYYSYWLYSALHIAVSVPSLQNLASLSKRFALPQTHILNHLTILEKIGLIKRQKDRWSWLSGDLHLSPLSPWIALHHSNWRNQAIHDAQYKTPESIHYSVVQSLSEDDLDQLKLRIHQWIKDFSRTASPSKPEELVCFNVDFFKVGAEK